MIKKKPSYNNTAAEEHKVISFKSHWSSLKLKSGFKCITWHTARHSTTFGSSQRFQFNDLFVPSILHLRPNLKRAEQSHKCSHLITTPTPPPQHLSVNYLEKEKLSITAWGQILMYLGARVSATIVFKPYESIHNNQR